MAKEIIEIGADTKDASKNINNLTDDVQGLNKEVNKSSGKGKDGLSGLSEGAKSSSKSVGGLSGAFKGLGTVLKATGIGALVALLVGLGDALSRNEKVSRFFSTAFEVINIVLDDFISFIVDNFSVVTDFFKELFENPVEKIKQFGNLIKENIIERFTSLLETLGFIGEAFKKLFQGDFAGALDSVKDAGKEFVDVLSGVDNSFDKVKDGISEGIETLKDYGKEVLETADTIEKLEKAVALAGSEFELLNKQFLKDAETQRQIRDDVRKPLEERIEANRQLGLVLEEQQKALLRVANLEVALASKKLALNKNTENQIALNEALVGQADVLESINGFRSEQLTNEAGLKNELLELNKARAKSEEELAFSEKEFQAERIKDEEARLEALIRVREEETNIELERLQNNIQLYKEGTQLRLDAEIEFNQRQLELKQEQIALEDELETIRTEKEKEQATKRAEATKKEEEDKRAFREQTLNNLGTLFAEEEKLQSAMIIFKQLMALKEQLIQLGVLKAKASAVVGEATLDSASAGGDIAKGFTATAKLGFPQAIPFLLGFGATAVGLISTIKKATSKAKSVASSIGGASSVGGGGGGSTPPPRSSFNIVGAPSVGNQLTEAIAEQGNQPIQTYVTVNDVNDAQGLQDNIVNSATISD